MDDTVTPDQLFQLCLTMLGSDKPTAARNLSMARWLIMTIGRGDDARLVFLPDLLPPEVLRVIGPCPAILLSAVLRGGKRQFGGKVAYAGSIRHKDPLLCAHGALARHLITRFMLEKAPVPDVLDPEEWRHTPLWTGNNPHESISYTQHADSLKAFLGAAGIIFTKVTHAFRMYKAHLDEQGVDDGLIARMGRWLRTVLNLCYLRFFKPQGLLAAAGWPQDHMDTFFAERFCLTFDDDEEMAELAAELLPVKEVQAMVNKMTRKQLDENPSAGALQITMDYLGRVGAQDGCGLLCCENEEVREAAAANPSIKFMLEKPRFRRLLAIFKDKLAAGGYEHLRPRSTRERVMDLAHGVQEIRDMLLGVGQCCMRWITAGRRVTSAMLLLSRCLRPCCMQQRQLGPQKRLQQQAAVHQSHHPLQMLLQPVRQRRQQHQQQERQLAQVTVMKKQMSARRSCCPCCSSWHRPAPAAGVHAWQQQQQQHQMMMMMMMKRGRVITGRMRMTITVKMQMRSKRSSTPRSSAGCSANVQGGVWQRVAPAHQLLQLGCADRSWSWRLHRQSK